MIFQRPIVGLDISERSIEMVEVVLRFGRWVIKRSQRTILPSGIIDRGEIKEPTALIEALEQMQKEGKISRKANVLLSFPDSLVFTTIISLPRDSVKSEFEKDLLFKARESLPLPIDESSIDWIQTTQTASEQFFVVSSAGKTHVESYRHVLEQSGFHPYIFDTQPFCSARGLGIEETSQPVALLDIGSIYSVISIFDTAGMQYNVFVEQGGDTITNQIAASLGTTFEQAEKLKFSTVLQKNQHSIKKEVRPRTKGVKKSKKNRKKALKTKKIDKNIEASHSRVQSIVESGMNQIFAELKDSIAYYEDQNEKKIHQVYLVGGGAQTKGLVDFIITKISAPITIGEIRKDVVKLPQESLLLLNAIGAGIRGLSNRPMDEGINFLK